MRPAYDETSTRPSTTCGRPWARTCGTPACTRRCPRAARCWTTRTSTPTTSPRARTAPAARCSATAARTPASDLGFPRGRAWLGTGLRRVAGTRPRRAPLLRRVTARDVAGRGGRGDRSRPPDRPAAPPHLGGARLRPVARRRLLADPEGDHARHGVRRLARPLGRRAPAPRGAGPPYRRVVVDGPARRERHHLRRSRLGAEDHRPARRHRHPVPGAADVAGEGAARSAVGRAARRGAEDPVPVGVAALHRYLAGRPGRGAHLGARPRLGPRRRGARARRPLDRRPGP